MKKFFVILLIVGIALSIFAAGNEEKTTKGEEANISMAMAWWGNQVRNERTQKCLDKYHELNPKVTIQGQPYNWADYWGKMATDAAGNNLADIVQIDLKYYQQYIDNKQLLDLTPYIKSGAIDTSHIPQKVLEMGKVGDGIYGLPAGINATCLWYNKTLTDSLGIKLSDNLKLPEFIEICKKITKETGYRAKLIYGDNYYEEWSRAEGIPLVEQKMPGKWEDYISYFKILDDGIKEGWHFPPSLVEGTAIEQEPLVYGSSPETMAWADLNGGSNLLAAFQAAAPEGVEISLTNIPTIDPDKSNFLHPAMLFCVNAKSKHLDTAIDILNYLINSEDANKILLGERGIPASTAIGDLIYPSLSEPEKKGFAYVVDVVTPHCSPINPPQPEGFSEYSDAIWQMTDKVAYGQLTPEEAAKTLYQKGLEIFGQ